MKHSPVHRPFIPVPPSLSFFGACLRRGLPFLLLTAGCLPAAMGVQTPAAQRAESTLLEPGRTIEAQLSGGESHEYHFSVQSGQYVNVSIEQRTIDVAVACFGPDGKDLFAAD